MCFWVMIFSALVGIILTILGISKQKENKTWIISSIIGVVLILYAIWLGFPK